MLWLEQKETTLKQQPIALDGDLSEQVGIREFSMKEAKRFQNKKREGVAFLNQTKPPISVDVIEEPEEPETKVL